MMAFFKNTGTLHTKHTKSITEVHSDMHFLLYTEDCTVTQHRDKCKQRRQQRLEVSWRREQEDEEKRCRERLLCGRGVDLFVWIVCLP